MHSSLFIFRFYFICWSPILTSYLKENFVICKIKKKEFSKCGLNEWLENLTNWSNNALYRIRTYFIMISFSKRPSTVDYHSIQRLINSITTTTQAINLNGKLAFNIEITYFSTIWDSVSIYSSTNWKFY